MTTGSRFLLLLANGFVCYYFWTQYKVGMSPARTLIFLFFSLVAINIALYLGQMLGEGRARQIAARRAQGK